jgi:hypothetical protein
LIRATIHFESGFHNHLKDSKVKYNIKVGSEMLELGKNMFPEIAIKLESVINDLSEDYDWQAIRFIDNKPTMKLCFVLNMVCFNIFTLEILFNFTDRFLKLL